MQGGNSLKKHQYYPNNFLSFVANVSAAHCTWKLPSTIIRIALGKSFSDYSRQQEFTQIMNVTRILQHPLYQDAVGNYGSDICLLLLEEPAVFNQLIRPVCIDWNRNDVTQHLKENSVGVVSSHLRNVVTTNDGDRFCRSLVWALQKMILSASN